MFFGKRNVQRQTWNLDIIDTIVIRFGLDAMQTSWCITDVCGISIDIYILHIVIPCYAQKGTTVNPYCTEICYMHTSFTLVMTYPIGEMEKKQGNMG